MGTNIVSRSTSRTSRELRPRSGYSVWVRALICFSRGPSTCPPSVQTALIIFSSALTTMNSSSVSLASPRKAEQALDLLPSDPVDVRDGAFDVDDDTYAGTVAAVVAEEIGHGEGAN